MGIIKYKDIAYGGGGGGQARGGTDLPAASLGANGDYYYQWDATGEVQIVYVKLSNVWHKITGGDVISGDMTSADYGFYGISGQGYLAEEGTINGN